MRPARLLVLCVLLLLGPSGCITWFIDPLGRHAAFKDTQRQYTQYVRWGELEKASAFVDPELREAFLRHTAALEGWRITDFDVGQVQYEDDGATVSVVYQGYSLDSFTERKIREDQVWYREGSSNRWRVRSNAAVFANMSGGAKR